MQSHLNLKDSDIPRVLEIEGYGGAEEYETRWSPEFDAASAGTPLCRCIEKIDDAQNLSIEAFPVSFGSVTHMKQRIKACRYVGAGALTGSHVFCRRQSKIQRHAERKKGAEISWNILPNGDNQNRKFLSECRKKQNTTTQQSAASAAVQSKTGNFAHRTRFEVRPGWGVPESVPVRAYQCLDWGVSKSRPLG